MLSWAYFWSGFSEQGKKLSRMLYKKREQMTPLQQVNNDFLYAASSGTPQDEIRCIRQYIAFDDQAPMSYFTLGDAYWKLYQYNEAIPEYKKSIKISNKMGLKPMWDYNYIDLGLSYHETGQYKEEKRLKKKAEHDFPDDPDLIYRQTVLALPMKKANTADKYFKRYLSILKENPSSEADIAMNLGWIYSDAGTLDEVEKYLRQAFSLEPEKPDRLNSLAWFLIDRDRNVNGGLALVDKALASSPDDYNYLHTKGWGLYKQGKYQEALNILQKSWDLRMQIAIWDREAFLHLEAAKKAVTGQKNN
jgi:tetratricopeptide (TPR) repeat protein